MLFQFIVETVRGQLAKRRHEDGIFVDLRLTGFFEFYLKALFLTNNFL